MLRSELLSNSHGISGLIGTYSVEVMQTSDSAAIGPAEETSRLVAGSGLGLLTPIYVSGDVRGAFPGAAAVGLQ